MSREDSSDLKKAPLEKVPPSPRNDRRKWKLPALLKEPFRTSLIFLLMLVILKIFDHYLIGSIIDSVKEFFNRPEQAVVLAVFPDSTTSAPMVKGLGLNSDSDETPIKADADGKWVIRRVREGNSPEATARKLREIISENNVVLVVGHESSTTAKKLIEDVYESDSFVLHGGAMPLLLPAVTNPEITQAPRGGQSHILRLPATDNKQVDTILQLLQNFQPPPKNVALVVDNANKEYSSYIASELIARSVSSAFTIVDAVGVDIFSAGFSPERFLKAKPDTIIFVGMEVEASIFIRRLKREQGLLFSQDKMRMVFTDGVAGDSFVRSAQGVLTPGESIYITGPFPPQAAKGLANNGFPTYEPYARLATVIISDILRQTKERGKVT